MLTIEETRKCFDLVGEVRQGIRLFDSHAHPFEIFFGDRSYEMDRSHDGLYSRSGAMYQLPRIGPVPLAPPSPGGDRQYDPRIKAKMAMLACRRDYLHTGPKVFGDHMTLSAIDRVLLLPVMGSSEAGEAQIELMARIFGADERFLLGYSVPNPVPEEEIFGTLRAAVARYGIRAVKVHPNITGIDPASPRGRERVEAILEASGEAGLPVVIHGGRSPQVADSQGIDFGTLKNLKAIDWGLSREPVVIAHAGSFGHDLQEVRDHVMPVLKKLLSRHDHLLVDISGMEVPELELLLRHVDCGRILFGSDALYHSQWQALVRLVWVLKRSVGNPEESFMRIVGRNPGAYIEKERTHHVGTFAH